MIVVNIRKQDSYFNAMNAAQPVVDEVARLARPVLTDLKEAQDPCAPGNKIPTGQHNFTLITKVE